MNQTVLITGAASGIGRAFADLFAARGYDMVLVGRNLAGLDAMKVEYAAKYGIHVLTIRKDLSREDAAQELYDAVSAAGLSVDVLLNNAGVGDYGRFVEIPWQRARSLAGLDMLTLAQLLQLYGADMARRGGGRILNLASIAAFEPGPYMAMYFAAKAFVFSLSQAVSKELEGTGVTVTCLCPGPTATNFERDAHMSSENKWFAPMTAEEVARAGFAALMRGKAVCIPKTRYRLLKLAAGFAPESLKRSLAAYINTGNWNDHRAHRGRKSPP